MLTHSLRRWTNIDTTLDKLIVCGGPGAVVKAAWKVGDRARPFKFQGNKMLLPCLLLNIPANTRRSPNVESLLSQRCRRWANINSTSGEYLMFSRFNIVGSLPDLEVASSTSDRQVRISNPASGGWCHLNHLTILTRFSWPSLGYKCAKVA